MALLVDDVLACAAAAGPDRLAVTLGDDALTFSQVRKQSHRLANALSGWGLSRGDRVAHWSDICLDAVPLQFALGRLGSAYAPLNPGYSPEEARAALEYLSPRLLVADEAHADRAEMLARELDIPLALLGGRGAGTSLDDLAAAASASEPAAAQPSEADIFNVFLTSGSTGAPKGVMISQRATWLRTFAGCQTTSTTGGRGQLVMFPLFHMAGWIFAYYAWSSHRPAHLVRRADAAELLSAARRYQPDVLYCIPAVWRRVLVATTPDDLATLKWALIGTSVVETELLQEIRERFPHTRTTVSYGSTEAGRAVSLPDADLLRKPLSVGLPVPGYRAQVAEDGELLLSGEMLMAGYYDLPAETAAVLEDGWYHTGDLVEQDGDGYLYVVGRKREIIRSGGESTAPIEVERALEGFPGVADLAVVGMPDPQWGEVVCAVLVMADGSPPPSVEELRGHLEGRLASHKHPRRVLVAGAIPRTAATGQIRRALLANLKEAQ